MAAFQPLSFIVKFSDASVQWLDDDRTRPNLAAPTGDVYIRFATTQAGRARGGGHPGFTCDEVSDVIAEAAAAAPSPRVIDHAAVALWLGDGLPQLKRVDQLHGDQCCYLWKTEIVKLTHLNKN